MRRKIFTTFLSYQEARLPAKRLRDNLFTGKAFSFDFLSEPFPLETGKSSAARQWSENGLGRRKLYQEKFSARHKFP